MIHMRQPFFSIVSAIVYLMAALLFASIAGSGAPLEVSGALIDSSVAWAASGVMFLMAYFSLVHLKYK